MGSLRVFGKSELVEPHHVSYRDAARDSLVGADDHGTVDLDDLADSAVAIGPFDPDGCGLLSGVLASGELKSNEAVLQAHDLDLILLRFMFDLKSATIYFA